MFNHEFTLLLLARARARELEKAARREELASMARGATSRPSLMTLARAWLARWQRPAPQPAARLTTTTTRAVSSAGR